MDIISRAEARMRGCKTFYTGRPCGRAHLSPRRTDNGDCVMCQRLRGSGKEYRQIERITPRLIAKAAGYTRYSIGRPCANGHLAERLVSNSQCVVCAELRRKRWAKTNRDKMRAKLDRWKKRHPEQLRSLARSTAARRRAAKAHPPWADRKAIAVFYAGCPPDHEVDHIIPLNGKNVSGLHIVENLKYIPKVENRLKSNKF